MIEPEEVESQALEAYVREGKIQSASYVPVVLHDEDNEKVQIFSMLDTGAEANIMKAGLARDLGLVITPLKDLSV